MLIKILIKYLLGYVRISIEGYYIERFINLCTTNKILIWNLKREKGVRLHFNIGIKDFYNAVAIAKKLKCKLKIERKRGLPFIINKYRKRKAFLFSLIVIIVVLYISSCYVWNIDIVVEDGLKLENIAEDVKNAGLETGMKKEYTNIIAKKAGTITQIIAQNGTAQVKVGDDVEEGQILIQGVMEGKYTGIRNVHSLGEVKAIVKHSKTEKFPIKEEQNVKTGKKETKYEIKFNKFQINFYKTLSNFKIYDTIEEEKKFRIFSNLYLPISVIKITNEELVKNSNEYTIEEITARGTKQLEEKIENEIENKNNILRKKCRSNRSRKFC